jgi:polysaccharide biosynthesis protein PelG
MAGIGWKLERMLERDTLGSTLQAYLTGVAVTSAPWLLTTAVLVTLRALARGHVAAELAAVEQVITLTYAVTLVLSAPIHVVVSRFAADRLFERRVDLIAVPLRRALTFSLVAFLAVGTVTMLIVRPPLDIAVPGALLTAVVAAQWLLLSVGGGMSSPAGVLSAFAAGAAISVLAALGLERAAGLGARGYLIGFTLGQGAALVGMLLQILRSLPSAESAVPRGALRGALREYHLLAISAVAVQAAVWIDKIVVWITSGSAAASSLASATALAWFTVVPAFAWIYVRVETSFYTVFRRYYRGIETGAALGELEASARAVKSEASRLVRGAAIVQLVVTLLALIGAPHLVRALELPPEAALSLRLSLIGASLQVLTLLALLLLYYLDLRREAVRVAILEVISIGGATLIAIAGGAHPALGAAIGSVIPAFYALFVVRRAVSHLVPDTFQSQPF